MSTTMSTLHSTALASGKKPEPGIQVLTTHKHKHPDHESRQTSARKHIFRMRQPATARSFGHPVTTVPIR